MHQMRAMQQAHDGMMQRMMMTVQELERMEVSVWVWLSEGDNAPDAVILVKEALPIHKWQRAPILTRPPG